MSKFKVYASKWMANAGIHKTNLQLVDMEEKADIISQSSKGSPSRGSRSSSSCNNERPSSAQMEEDTKRLYVSWHLIAAENVKISL